MFDIFGFGVVIVAFIAGTVVGPYLTGKVTGLVTAVENSRALKNAQAVVNAEKARIAAIEAAQEIIAAAKPVLPPAPPNPLATGTTGPTGG